MQTQAPLVSVVMPAHNAQPFIDRAIESILNQTYRSIELIIIDDASTDQTVSIVNTYTDPRLKLIRRSESGCSGVVARNDGLDVAKGAFIAVADADDISVPDRLKIQVNHLLDNPQIDLLGGGIQEIDSEEKPTGNPRFRPCYHNPDKYRKAMLQSRNVLIHGTLMFRRHILNRLKGYNPLLTSGDTEFLMRATRYFHFSNLQCVLIRRRIHPQSITQTFGKKLRSHVHAILLHREYLWATKEAQRIQSQPSETNTNLQILRSGCAPSGTDPLISVAMATHNCAPYLEQAIESILSQTYARFEFIIVDDASTDDSIQILEQYTDPRITLLKRSECGCSGNTARNDALAMVQGDLIAIADADDINLPYRFGKQVAFLNKHPECDLLGAGIQPINAMGEISGRPEFKPAYQRQERYRNALLNDRNIILHPTLMFRKCVLDRLGPYSDFASSADFEYFLQASRYFAFYNLREVLVHYRQHEGSVTSRYGKAILHYHHSLFHAREYVWVQKQIETLQSRTKQSTPTP